MATPKKPIKKAAKEAVPKETKDVSETSPAEDSQENPKEEKQKETQDSPESKPRSPAKERIIVLLDRETHSIISSFTGTSRSSVVRAILIANIERLSALDRSLSEERIVEALK